MLAKLRLKPTKHQISKKIRNSDIEIRNKLKYQMFKNTIHFYAIWSRKYS